PLMQRLATDRMLRLPRGGAGKILQVNLPGEREDQSHNYCHEQPGPLDRQEPQCGQHTRRFGVQAFEYLQTVLRQRFVRWPHLRREALLYRRDDRLRRWYRNPILAWRRLRQISLAQILFNLRELERDRQSN